MMASFGVVIDSNEPPSPKKRRILPADNNEGKGIVKCVEKLYLKTLTSKEP